MDQPRYNSEFLRHLMSAMPDNREVKSNNVNLIPNTSIRYIKGKYYVELEIPGANPEDIKVLIRDNTINIDMKKFYINEEDEELVENSEDAKAPTYKNYVNGGYSSNNNYLTGMFSYNIVFPYRIAQGDIESFYKWGILTFVIQPQPSVEFNLEITSA